MNSLGLGDPVTLLPTEENVHNQIDGQHGVITGGGNEQGLQLFKVRLFSGRAVSVAADAVKLRIQTKPPKQAQD